MKRISFLILCVLLCFAVFSIAVAEKQPCENGFYYEVKTDGTARITGYDYSVLPTTASLLDLQTARSLNPAYDVIIPSSIGGCAVTEAIIEPALWAYTFIPETVTHLEVRMPSERDLDSWITLVDPQYALIGIRRITDSACWRTTDGQIDRNIDRGERIGVEVDENNPVYVAEDGIVYDRIGNELIFAANSADTSHTHGDQFKPIRVKDGTKRVGDYAFANCITGTVIVLPDSVTEYGTDCFPHGTCATKLPVSVMYNSEYYCVDEQRNTLTLAGWMQSYYASTLSKMMSSYCGSQGAVVVPYWNQYVYNLLDTTSCHVEAVLDPNSFTGLYIPAKVTGITFKSVTDEDGYVPCLIGVEDNEFYSVRDTEDPQLIFVEEDHPTFSVRNGMLYDKAGETLIYCPRRGHTVTIPEGTKKVLKNAFLAWPGGTVIAAENGMEWEEQLLRDGSVPTIVPLTGFTYSAAAEEEWHLDDTFQPQGLLAFRWFPKKSGTELYSFEYGTDSLLSVSGSKTADDISYKSVPTDNDDEVLLQIESSAGQYLVPYAISEERFEYFLGFMKKADSKKFKSYYKKWAPAKMTEGELQELCTVYSDLAEGKTVYILKDDISLSNQEKIAEILAKAGYTEEDYLIDMSGVRLPGVLSYTLSCTASRRTDGRDIISSFKDLSLTSVSAEKCEYLTLNPGLGACIPEASDFMYMPRILVEDVQYHASCKEDRWDWWYADLDAGADRLPVYSQEVPDGVYICTVTSDLPLRIRVPADMTFLSTAAGEYARVQIRTDENGNAAGNVTVEYRFVPANEITD